MNRVVMTLAAFGLVGTLWAAEPTKPAPTNDRDIQDFIFLTQTRPILIRARLTVGDRSFRAAWEAYVDRVFQFLDTDGNGIIGADELKRMPPAQLITGSGPSMIRSAAGADSGPDDDSDGQATREELANWLRRSGAAPFQVGEGSSGLSGVRFVNLNVPSPINADQMNRALFALLDTDRDGKLSAPELAAAPTRLMALDANDDEMIVPSELLTAEKRDPAFPGTNTAHLGKRTNLDDEPDNKSPIILVNSADSGTKLARKLLQVYGSKGPPARKLSAADLGLDAETFDRLDADRNGHLDSEELAQFAKRPADVELSIRLGATENAAATVEAVSRAAGVQIDPLDGGAILEVGTTRVELRAGPPPGNARMNFNFRLRDLYINNFKMADTDHNNYLDEKEANANPLFRGVFKALDRDGDGMLYEKEMVESIDRLEELQKSIRDGCFTLTVTDKGSGLFEQFDRDRDGRLSVRELRQVVEWVKRLDRDGDSALSLAEVPRHYEARVKHGPTASANGNNLVVVAAESFGDSTAKPESTLGPIWFRKMDTNRDGDLSRREFLGSDADFARLDTDGDGLISAAEAEQFKPTNPRP